MRAGVVCASRCRQLLPALMGLQTHAPSGSCMPVACRRQQPAPACADACSAACSPLQTHSGKLSAVLDIVLSHQGAALKSELMQRLMSALVLPAPEHYRALLRRLAALSGALPDLQPASPMPTSQECVPWLGAHTATPATSGPAERLGPPHVLRPRVLQRRARPRWPSVRSSCWSTRCWASCAPWWRARCRGLTCLPSRSSGSCLAGPPRPPAR